MFNSVVLATMSFVIFVCISAYALLFLSSSFRSVVRCPIVVLAALISSIISTKFTISIFTVCSRVNNRVSTKNVLELSVML